jgi:hypothetical protein
LTKVQRIKQPNLTHFILAYRQSIPTQFKEERSLPSFF